MFQPLLSRKDIFFTLLARGGHGAVEQISPWVRLAAFLQLQGKFSPRFVLC